MKYAVGRASVSTAGTRCSGRHEEAAAWTTRPIAPLLDLGLRNPRNQLLDGATEWRALRDRAAERTREAAHDIAGRSRALDVRVGAECIEDRRSGLHALLQRRTRRDGRRRELPSDVPQDVTQLTLA